MSNEFYPAYWIELAKRAYTDGHDEALAVIDRALRMNQDEPCGISSFYDIRWFFDYWLSHRFGNGAVPADLR